MNLRNIFVPAGVIGLVLVGYASAGWPGVAAVVNLMHVMAMTQSLGERLSAENAQPEVYRWTDGTQSHVTCEFANGRLQKWTLERPQAEAEAE